MAATGTGAFAPRFDIQTVINRAMATLRAHGVVLVLGSLLIIGATMSGSRFLLQSVMTAWTAADGVGFTRTFWLTEVMGMFDMICGALVTAWVAVVVITGQADPAGADPGAALGLVFRRASPIAIQTFILAVGMIFGLILLVVPGVLLMLGWALATPAMMAERLSPIQALRRSWRLTRGYRGGVFALFLVWVVPLLVIEVLLAKLFGGPGTFVRQLASPSMRLWVLPIVGAFTHVVFAAGLASAYVELVNLKEGGVASRIGEVFA